MLYRRAFAGTMALVVRDTNHGECTNHGVEIKKVVDTICALEDCHENPFEHFVK